MLQAVEAELDVNGNVRLLEPLPVDKPSRVIVTLLQETNGVMPTKGEVSSALKFLLENRLPKVARPSIQEIEAQIAEARESWD